MNHKYVKEIVINTFEEFIDEVMLKLQKGWIYRGQSSAYKLLPSILREESFEVNGDKYLKELKKLILFYRECNNIGLYLPKVETFSRQSQTGEINLYDVLYKNCIWLPNDDTNDLFGLETLAQHYGLKTRFLDWTQNVLVALYFATLETENDTSLWCINSSKLEAFRNAHIMRIEDIVRDNYKKKIFDYGIQDTMEFQLFNDSLPLVFYTPRYNFNNNLNVQKGVLSIWLHNLACFNPLDNLYTTKITDDNFRSIYIDRLNAVLDAKYVEKPVEELLPLYLDYYEHKYNDLFGRYFDKQYTVLIKYKISKSIIGEIEEWINLLGVNRNSCFPTYNSVTDMIDKIYSS